MAQINAGAGANGDIFATDIAKDTKTSVFDLSRITNLTGDTGMIIPFDWLETLPKDKFIISAETALETMPTITNILTPYHVRTHWYYMRNSDLWEGFETLITKGRSGNINWTIPQIDVSEDFNDGTTFSTPHSLQTFLGNPPRYGKNINENSDYFLEDYLTFGKAANKAALATEYTETGYSNVKDGVSALPFMAYQAICKYNYIDQNLLQNNHHLFPEEGDSNWRLPAKGNPTYINAIKYEDGHIKGIHETSLGSSRDGIYTSSDASVSLLELRYAQYEDDAFTSALPWAQRGTAETMETTIDMSNLEINISGSGSIPKTTVAGFGDEISSKAALSIKGNPNYWAYDPRATTSFEDGDALNQMNVDDMEGKWGYIIDKAVTGGGITLSGTKRIGTDWERLDSPGNYLTYRDFANAMTITHNGAALDVGLGITANDLRNLIAMSVWQERNAQVNGSYNSMIWIHYKHNPKAQEHYPQYIGGTSDYIQFGEVISTAETADNPQGTVTSTGKLYMQQEVGQFEVPDYGIIMGVLIITPMTTYNTTTPKELFKKTAEDFYFPEFDNLGAMPIQNKELFTKGNTTTDNGLYGYAKNRYYWMKTRQNVNRGLFQMPSQDSEEEATDSLFSAGTQAREFDDTPALSYQFKAINPRKQRRDWLAYKKEPMFKIQVASKIKAIRPMAYNSQPETFGF